MRKINHHDSQFDLEDNVNKIKLMTSKEKITRSRPLINPTANGRVDHYNCLENIINED